jgi:hypothetical protein
MPHAATLVRADLVLLDSEASPAETAGELSIRGR